MNFTTVGGNSFELLCTAKLNTNQTRTQLQQQLSELEKISVVNVRAKFDGKDAIKQITTYKDAMGKLVETQAIFDTQMQKITRDSKGRFTSISEESITKVKDLTKSYDKLSTSTETTVSATGRLITRVKEYKDDVLQSVTVTQQWRNAQGQLETQTQKLDARANKLDATIRTTSNDTAKVVVETNKYIDAQGREVTETAKLDSQLNGVVEIVTRQINAQGLLTKTTEEMVVSQGNAVASTRRLVSSETELANVDKTLTTEISRVIDAQGREITTTRKLDSQLNGTVEIITKEKNAQGQLITTTERMNVANNQNVTSTRQVTRVIEEETRARKSASDVLKQQIGFQSDFIATMGKIIKFQVITKIITGFTTACRSAVNVVKEFDSALTEFKKVSDLSGESLDNYTQKLGELGTAVARTRTQMVEASTQFKKSGFSDEDSANLAQISSLYQNIADSEMSAGDSATFIISQMKAFKDEFSSFNTEAEKATSIIDAINEVSNNMAVSSTDIAIALSKTASAMGALGNSYEESIALVTSGTEIMQGQASKVARGLRSFGNQIAKVATEAGELTFEVQGVTRSIALMGADGNLKSTYKVLQEISKEWNNMTTAERQALGISLAGKTQFEVFTSVLTNFAGAERALTLAIESEGSAWNENARYMESIEAKFQALKTAVQNLVLGDGGLSNFVKWILDVSTSIVKLIDNAGGLLTIIGAITSALILLNAKAIMKLLFSIPTLISNINQLGSAYIAFAMEASTANEILTASIPIVGLVLVVLTELYSVISLLINAHSMHIEKLKEENQELSNQKSQINQATDELERLKEQLEKLNEIDNPTLVQQREIDRLEYKISQLERELALKKEIAKEDEKSLTKKAEKVVSGKLPLDNRVTGFGFDKSISGISGNVERLIGEDFDIGTKLGYQRIKAYADMQISLQNFVTNLEEENKALDKNSTEYANNVLKINEANGYVNTIKENLPTLTQELIDITNGLSENNKEWLLAHNAVNYVTDALGWYSESTESSVDNTEYLTEDINNLAKEYGLTEAQVAELTNKVNEAIDAKSEEESAYEVGSRVIEEYRNQLNEAKFSMEEWNASMDAFQESYKTLSSAVDEYNSAEGMTIDTLQSLLALDPEYLSMLDMENGKLVLNKQALIDKATAQINEAKALVYAEAIERLKILADEKQKTSSENASTGIDEQTDALKRNTQALIENNEKEVLNWTIKAKNSGASLSEIQEVINDMRTQLSIINGVADSVSVNFDKAMATGRDASDKARNSLNKTNKTVDETKQKLEQLKQKVKELKDEVAEYDKVIDYINDKLDEEIDTLEEQRDTEIKAIEEQIDALERLEDEYEDSVNERIKELERERDALIDSNKLEISSLQEKKNEEEAYWNEKIQALKDQNQELQNQADLQKLLDNLEKARNTKIKVYKKGKGFVWETDQNAVSKAEKELQEYNRKKDYEKQLAELEKFKKEALDNYEQQINDLKTLNDNLKNQYDKQIDELKKTLEEKKKKFKEEKTALEDRKKEIQKHYDAEIKVLEDYKKKFNKQVKAYEQEQLRLLTIQKTGIDTEDANWKTRLSNLDSFLVEYQKKLKALEDAEKELAEFEKNNAGGGSTTTSGSPTGDNGGTTDNGNPDPPKGNTKQVKRIRTIWYANGKKFGTQAEAQAEVNRAKNELNNQINSIRNAYGMPQSAKDSQIATLQGRINSLGITQGSEEYYETITYAKGTPSIGSNQFAIVGENPNKELVIGSRLNGLGLNLAKGTGVVNAKSTGTLAGLFNMLGGELGKVTTGNYSTNSLSNQSVNNYHIDNISLPQVRDAEDFIKALSNFDNIMAQKAYSF